MVEAIPVKNIFHLLTYSWDILEAGDYVDLEKLSNTDLLDLIGGVLIDGTRHLLRRGLDQTYLSKTEEISGVRGKVNVGATARRMLLKHGRANCSFDELSVDCLHNQIIYSTLCRLARSPSLDRHLASQTRFLVRELKAISEIRLSKRMFNLVQLHGNNRAYRFLLNVCELYFDATLLSEEPGNARFHDFIRDERKMAKLFENFIFNFYRLRSSLRVKREFIRWNASSETDPNLSLLPSMKTDISLRSETRTLVIDAKFYGRTFQVHYDKESVHSGNLYQIYAYLKNLEPNGGSDTYAEGMLLYPVVTREVMQTYELPGHKIHIATLNLMDDWRAIEERLLSFL